MKMPDFGTETVLEVARALISAGTALYLTWKGRARWEPSEIDVPQLPQKIVGFLSAMLLFWSSFDPRWTRDPQRLGGLLIFLCSLCVAAALLYTFITATNVYYKKVGERKVQIIGGFYLTRHAKREIKRHKLPIQKYLIGKAGNDPDRVWPRSSRAGMKVLFVVCYITMSVAGTGALSFAAQGFTNRRTASTRDLHLKNLPKPKPTPAPSPAQQTPAQENLPPSSLTPSPTPGRPDAKPSDV